MERSNAAGEGGDSGVRQSGAQVFRFSSDAFREHERIAAWRETFARTLLKLDIVPRTTENFRAEATVLRSARFGVLRASTSPVDQGNSSRSMISNDNVSFVWMCSCRSRASQLGRSDDLEPGDAVLFSHCDVGGLAFSDTSRYVALALPKSALAPLVPDIGAVFARRVPASNPAQRMLLRYLDLAEDDQVATDADLQRVLGDHVCDLVALALGATRNAAELARVRGVPAARLRAMQDDIRRSAHDANLNVRVVAARYGVSARYVQRVFEESGSTFTQYVTEQRLALAYRTLNRRVSSDVPISTVAYDCGFSDVSHFNRLFRRRFGCTPSDVRDMARNGGA
jgi:AraC-like DNA-binding protein